MDKQFKPEICPECGLALVKPVYFIDEERSPFTNAKTGRIRTAVSHLLCEGCGRNFCIDDSFDGPWHYPNRTLRENKNANK